MKRDRTWLNGGSKEQHGNSIRKRPEKRDVVVIGVRNFGGHYCVCGDNRKDRTGNEGRKS